jgi:competence protein ComGC
MPTNTNAKKLVDQIVTNGGVINKEDYESLVKAVYKKAHVFDQEAQPELERLHQLHAEGKIKLATKKQSSITKSSFKKFFILGSVGL